MPETITTLHNYEIGLTTELTHDQERRLAVFLSDLAKEGSGRLLHASVIWGKTGRTPVSDFNPFTISNLKEEE